MNADFPSVDGLTWQEWRTNTFPMESTGNMSALPSGSRSSSDSSRGTLANPNETSHWYKVAYHESQLLPNDRYGGTLDCMELDEAEALLAELFARFHIGNAHGLALPPSGLPGFRHDEYCADDPAARIIEIGAAYVAAMVLGQPRAMHLRWREAQELHRLAVADGAGKTIQQWADELEARDERRKAAAPLVYFIGASSGPIKIGMAVNPLERMRTLQTSHHDKLSLLATCRGGHKQERAYHKHFTSRRLSGEWFARCPEIEAEIARLNNDSL